MFRFFSFFIPITFLLNLSSVNGQTLELNNGEMRAVFLPGVGGRLVFLGTPGGGNILFSDSTLWNEAESERMPVEPRPGYDFKAYNGFISWLGPQSDWWNQQDVLPEKKGDLWPPDPYLVYGQFEVNKQSTSELVMTGPESAISGIKMIKSFRLDGRLLHISTSAVNVRSAPVSWDVWSNARFNAFARARVPVNKNSVLKIETVNNQEREILEHEISDGFFSFLPELPENNRKRRMSKAYLYPAEGTMMVESMNYRLSITFDLIPARLIHPEQALVEVYNCVSADGTSDLLEMEHHSAYHTMAPGDTITLREVWKLESF